MHGVIRVGRARVGRARVGRARIGRGTLTDNGRAKFFHGRCAAGPRINENNNRDILGSVVCENNNIGKKDTTVKTLLTTAPTVTLRQPTPHDVHNNNDALDTGSCNRPLCMV